MAMYEQIKNVALTKLRELLDGSAIDEHQRESVVAAFGVALEAKVASSNTPIDEQVKKSVMEAVMVKVNAIADKPASEVIEDEGQSKFRELVIKVRARFARFREELDTTGKCTGLMHAIMGGGGEENLLDQELQLLHLLVEVGGGFLMLEMRARARSGGSGVVQVMVGDQRTQAMLELVMQDFNMWVDESVVQIMVAVQRTQGMLEFAKEDFIKWNDELMGIDRPDDPDMPHSYTVSNDRASVACYAWGS